MFSPYYAWARRRGPTDPERFCAFNVALYGASGARWAMTERGRGHLSRTRDTLAIGPSHLGWEGDTLVARLDETAFPLPHPLRGTVRFHPQALPGRCETLAAAGQHQWCPIAPSGRIEVALTQPRLRWSGHGYLDSNWGDEPLARGFRDWDWARATLRLGTMVLYDARRRDGTHQTLALRFDASGRVEPFAPPPSVRLPPTHWWRLPRTTLNDADDDPRVIATFEDTPFYARSLLRAQLLGERTIAIHESLSLDRFERPWVRALLPFRMPRWERF